jgi:hypothetical protein
MKLYKISQEENRDYDTYDSAVVIAESEDEARLIHPYWYGECPYFWRESDEKWCYKADGRVVDTYVKANYGTLSWTSPEFVQVEYLGEAKEGSVTSIVCSSFNAG